MELKSLKRDSAAISAGQWVKDIPSMGDLELRVRGLTSPTATAYRSKKERAVPNSDRNRDGSIKQEVHLKILAETMAETMLLDWRGLTDQGEPVPYDKELALQLLTDPDMVPFADAVAYAANAVDRGLTTEDQVKN